MKPALFFLSLALWSVSLTACGPSPEPAQESPDSGASSSQPSPSAGETTESAVSVIVYLGTDGQFAEYPVEYTGDRTQTGQVPATEVLAAMEKLTGWDLALSHEIDSGRGGITVTFADTCTLLSDLPEGMTAEDALERDRVVLDSVKRTLQCCAIDPELGDPDAVDIWFCGPGGGDLTLSGTEVTISSTEPYEGLPSS